MLLRDFFSALALCSPFFVVPSNTCLGLPIFRFIIHIGGRVYPVRHYPIAIRLHDLAFDNKVALTVNYVNIRATCASALPTRSRSSWGPHDILRHSMYCALSSEWELFGRNTRSAFRRTPSPRKYGRIMQPICIFFCTSNICLGFCQLTCHPKKPIPS